MAPLTEPLHLRGAAEPGWVVIVRQYQCHSVAYKACVSRTTSAGVVSTFAPVGGQHVRRERLAVPGPCTGDPCPMSARSTSVIRTPSERLTRSSAPSIDGPILTASGGQDEVWPSPLYTDALHHRLSARHVAHAHRNLYFDGAGHGLGLALPYVPTPTSRAAGGTARADPAARAVLWLRVLTFLRSR